MVGAGGRSWQGRASHASGIEQCVAAWHGMAWNALRSVLWPNAACHATHSRSHAAGPLSSS